LNTLPVLVTCFSRPDLLELTLKSLRESEIPIQLFVHIDGPRKDFPGDYFSIEECKRVIDSLFAPDCIEIKCLDHNLGVRHAMLSAIDWFFEFVEYGLIVEEDVIIHHEATKLILPLLSEFSNDFTIGAISLHNNLPEKYLENVCELYLSNFTFLWGWATWKSRWLCTSGGIENAYSRLVKSKIRHKIGVFGFLYSLKFLTFKAKYSWDGDLQLNYWEKGYRTIHFKKNLAWNIGFDERATHTKKPIQQRQIFSGDFDDHTMMSRDLETKISLEKKYTKYVFGIKGIRLKFQYFKWFVRTWSLLKFESKL
jgi:hypothetical protein